MTCGGSRRILRRARMCSSVREERCLGLDVGDRRIGVAFSRGWMAVPRPTLEAADEEAALRKVSDLISSERVEVVVYGVPYDAAGRSGPQAEKVLAFVRRLEARHPGVRFEARDEGLTSWEAERRLAGRVGRKERRRAVDRVAAALILQGYLDSKHRRLS